MSCVSAIVDTILEAVQNRLGFNVPTGIDFNNGRRGEKTEVPQE